jgi:hypothetical protein
MTRSGHHNLWHSLVFAVSVCLCARPAFASLCLEITGNPVSGKIMPIAPGDQVRINFRHSIYGSAVEEILTVRAQGLQLTELRYGEARLVEFYGHERAYREHAVWVVRPAPVIFPELSFRASDAAAMNLSVLTQPKPITLPVPPASALRIRLSSCKPGANG